MTPIPTDLAEELRDYLKTQSAGAGAAGLLERIERCLTVEPKVSRAWLMACLAAVEESPKAPPPPGSMQTDDMAGASGLATPPQAPKFENWHEDHRVLVSVIHKVTGVAPWKFEDAHTHRLGFRIRTRDGDVVERDVPFSGTADSLAIALRNVARIVKLDHSGPPL